MKRTFLTLILTLLLSSVFYAQNNYDEFWDILLNNQREKASKTFDKLKKDNSLEYLLIKEILRVEKGEITNNTSFLDVFLGQPEFENYLYALWNDSFLFDSYLTAGFKNKNIKNIDKVYNTSISSTSLQDAIHYLKSVSARYQNDWESYYELNDKILSIRNWQYCGVFENLNKSGLDKIYEPETKAFSETPFDAKSNGLVNWYNANNKKEAYQFFTNHEEYGSGVNYGQTFIEMTENKRVILRIGNGSAFKVWLNDVLIFEQDEDVTTELDAYQVKVNLLKGNNRLLIKNAETNYGSYFIISALDEDKNPIKLESTSEYSPYNSNTFEELNPILLDNEFEQFFINKRKTNPDNFLYDYCLLKTYFRNSKFAEAKEIILPLLKRYPKSSLIRKLLIIAYDYEGDYTSIKELRENIEIDDSDYYLPLIIKIKDLGELSRMSLSELETFLNKFRKSTDLKLFDITADFYLNARKEEMKSLKKNLDELIKESEGHIQLQIKYAPLYASVFQDDVTTIKILERQNKNYFSLESGESLAYYYDKQGKKDEAVQILSRYIDQLSVENSYLYGIIKKLHGYEKYNESLKYIDQALNNFPYSFIMMELKGDALLQLSRKKEAIEYYEQSLKYNSSNSELRKKIKDLKNEENLLDELARKDVYDFIKENKGKVTTNNYGFNIFLEDGNVELYLEGGGKYRYVYVYEITSDSGIERFKEYNLGLSGNYTIIKSEIVKKDGSLVPADRSGSNLVFKGLSVGDIIYIDYENSFSSTGRFYKDYTDYFNFDAFHPVVESSFQILVPKSRDLKYKVTNGNIEVKKRSFKNHNLYEWTIINNQVLPQDEYYMPEYCDIARVLHYSTIESWNDIANWYSDLVRSKIEMNSTVKEIFNNLFPDGYETLTDEEKAKRIYKYIMDNLTYSYVSFRQSGFVPQKPSKTINTTLGDCKDFSTLFVTLGRMAGLDTNLVLILTSDYGEDALVLPSQNFNHCIAKVNLDGNDQYLELTDKYLPFASLPVSLRNAIALDIPYEVDENKISDLFLLSNVNRDLGVLENDLDIKILEDYSEITVKTKIMGHVKSFYSTLVSEPNFEVRKKFVFDYFKERFENDFTLNELKDIKESEDGKILNFTSKITLNKKTDKIGSISIFKLPIIAKAYTNDIIETQERNYPINYINYENTDIYTTDYTISIPEGKKFVEIPENINLTFKEHSYKIVYDLVSDSVLKVSINAKPGIGNIDTEDYKAFREYVISVLEAKDSFIGFK